MHAISLVSPDLLIHRSDRPSWSDQIHRSKHPTQSDPIVSLNRIQSTSLIILLNPLSYIDSMSSSQSTRLRRLMLFLVPPIWHSFRPHRSDISLNPHDPTDRTFDSLLSALPATLTDQIHLAIEHLVHSSRPCRFDALSLNESCPLAQLSQYYVGWHSIWDNMCASVACGTTCGIA